jgi:putative ABC transport system ATP-binding protein
LNIVLQAKQICKSYYSDKFKVEALKRTDFIVHEGSIIVIVGKSGSGKSTLLKVLGGLIKPDEGQVLIDQIPLYEISESKRTRLRSTKIGFIFQEFNLINELSIINNIRLPFDINGLHYDIKEEEEIVGMLEIKKRLHFYPEQISGGERQRTAIARALLLKPSIILADEPTGNLDLESGKNVMDFVEMSNCKNKQTYVIVTHDVEWLRIAHHVYRMSDGILKAEK